ncbi:MAG: glycosyltransferase, partial [Methylococcaceae bacterium]|nr:glycosyltransferase [Methylococcaceae bacterium]
DPARVEQWRARLGEDFFLFIGVLRYYKGLHTLLEAARGAPFKIAIVGRGSQEKELKSYVESNHMENVHFLGGLADEDKVALLHLCQALLMPSQLRSEAFGVSLLEAAMFAKPQITCEIGTGTSFVNRHEETGLIVPPNDAQGLRCAIERIMASTEERKRWGENARRQYLEKFTGNRMAASYVELYRELIEQQQN